MQYHRASYSEKAHQCSLFIVQFKAATTVPTFGLQARQFCLCLILISLEASRYQFLVHRLPICI